MLVSALPFILASSPYAISSNTAQLGNPANQTLLVPAKKLAKLAFFLRYSFVSFGSWLVDMGAYETTHVSAGAPLAVLWNLFAFNATRLLCLSWGVVQKSSTLELFYRNAKWLEREVTEMHGWLFELKRDRRTLFLMPVFFSTPLKKAFPLGGFFEVLLCPLTSKLTFRHVSWLS